MVHHPAEEERSVDLVILPHHKTHVVVLLRQAADALDVRFPSPPVGIALQLELLRLGVPHPDSEGAVDPRVRAGGKGLSFRGDVLYGEEPGVKEGQTVDVKVLSIDREAQRMALSLKATQAEPEGGEQPSGQARQEPARPLAVPPRNKPLKGGTDRKSGGEQFGLKW